MHLIFSWKSEFEIVSVALMNFFAKRERSDDVFFSALLTKLCDDDTVENFVIGDSINDDQS